MAAFDIESTGVDVETARIVTAAFIVIGPTGVIERRTWLADPGVEIPAGATEIHGITTEHARAHGHPAAEVLTEIAAAIERAWGDYGDNAVPLVGMNLAYDLTVLQRELARHGLGELEIGPCLDVFVIDRAVDTYRKGPRRLADLARHYLPPGAIKRMEEERAHDAAGDALAAARVMYMLARHPRYGPGLQAMTLPQLQAWQAREHAARQASFRDYLRREGKPADDVDGSWPWRPAPTVAPV